MPRSPADPPVAEWSTLWKDMQPTLAKIRRSMITARTTPIKVMRVSQLDSDILDSELFSILKEQLWSALSLFKASIGGAISRFRVANLFPPIHPTPTIYTAHVQGTI